MEAVLALLAVLVAFGVIMGGLAWLAARVRRRGIGDAMMGPFDEIWHPAAHRARLETQVQVQRPAPAPSPGDRSI